MYFYNVKPCDSSEKNELCAFYENKSVTLFTVK